MYVECPDGPPRRSALCFTFQRTVHNAPWRDRAVHLGATLQEYAVTTTAAGWSWLSKHRNNESGYFLTGVTNETSLWRVLRIEDDPFRRAIFTLSPVRLTASLLRADFSSIDDELLQRELQHQYEELARAIDQHAFREVVTKAKNIAEGIVAYRLHLLEDGDRFATALAKIKELLEEKTTRDTCGWTFLQYHVANKLRILHGQTHATTRSSLRPEFALSTVEDLNFLLREWGVVI